MRKVSFVRRLFTSPIEMDLRRSILFVGSTERAAPNYACLAEREPFSCGVCSKADRIKKTEAKSIVE